LALWEKHWSEHVAKQAVWLGGLVPFAQAEQTMREVGRVDISQSSVWCRVERWGGKLQALETLQQAKAYGFEEPENLDRKRSLWRMGVAMDGTMVHIRGEGWKEKKLSCVFDFAKRRQAYRQYLDANCGRKPGNAFGCMRKIARSWGMGQCGFGTSRMNIFIPVINCWIGIMRQNISPTRQDPAW
jgi:hypothetical protein